MRHYTAALIALILLTLAPGNATVSQSGPPSYPPMPDLVAAAEREDLEAVKSLLDSGADIEAKSQYGFTALHAAVSKGHAAIVDLLLTRGADVEARSNGDITPLMTAAF